MRMFVSVKHRKYCRRMCTTLKNIVTYGKDLPPLKINKAGLDM